MVLYALNAVLFITETKIRCNSIPSVFCLKSRAFQELSAEHLTCNVWKSWEKWNSCRVATSFENSFLSSWSKTLINHFFYQHRLGFLTTRSFRHCGKDITKRTLTNNIISLTTSLLKSNWGMLIVSVLLGRSCGSLNLRKFAIAMFSHEFLFLADPTNRVIVSYKITLDAFLSSL